jgi:hypothetical protein
MWRGFALCLLMPLIALADETPASSSAATDSPEAKLRAARALLDARGSHREKRVYSSPNPLTQVVEFAGKRQRWINEFNDDGKQSRQETIWEGGRSASRRLPDSAAWQCNPPIDDALTEPRATVSDGGYVTVDGHAAHRYIEKFTNEPARGTVTHLVDVDEKSGLPLQITSTESDGGVETRYVGTYFDIGVPITIDFPAC